MVCAGRVDDPYDEFFIEERSLEGPSTGIDGMDIYDEEYCKTPAPHDLSLPRLSSCVGP